MSFAPIFPPASSGFHPFRFFHRVRAMHSLHLALYLTLYPALFLVAILPGLLPMSGAMAQTTGASASGPASPVPERRITVMRDTDFPGRDLGPIFGTDLAQCEKRCLDDAACGAFTFNTAKGACFPKSGVDRIIPFAGAVSARVIATSAQLLVRARAQAARLDFLPADDLAAAHRQATDMGLRYAPDDWRPEQLLSAARDARKKGDFPRAGALVGAALTLTDAPQHWVLFARDALRAIKADKARRTRLAALARSAAINAFLRAEASATEAAAMDALASALVAEGRGRLAIRAQRLASDIRPLPARARALERLIATYGFRIIGHSVDNNAAMPRICATFSEDLVAGGVDYATYLRLPERGLAVESRGRQICVEGVRHGETYSLTFRKGLPAASGEVLSRPVSLEIYVRDRDPAVHFAGRAYVLPRGQGARIPVTTVNTTELDLRIHRIGARNLVRVIRQRMFGNALSQWDERDITRSLGEEIWSGKGEVAMELNRDITTALPVGKVIGTLSPGVYVLRARVPGSDPYDSPGAAQWFIITDLGLSTMKGADGLHVLVRGLGDGAARMGARVRLIARNNEVLAEAATDARGYVRFGPALLAGPAGKAAQMITVRLGDDFAFLDLSGPAFDLSDRGVAGRDAPPPIDIFATTDRGAYRPGETVYMTALARDGAGNALTGLPLNAVVTRPDGVTFARRLLPDLGGGGHVMKLGLPDNAMRGTWTVRLHADPKAPPLAQRRFLVEDFTPERVDFDLALSTTGPSLPGGAVRADRKPVVEIAARYLYGAPAADLAVEAEARVRPADGLPGFPGYAFGRYDADFAPSVEYARGKVRTDSRGRARVVLGMPAIGATSRPLALMAVVRLREGSGRPVERVLERPIAPRATVIGIRTRFDGVLPEGGTARFDVIAVGPDLRARPLPPLRWVMNRIRTRYQWYQTGGDWRYEPVTTRTRVASGRIEPGRKGPVAVAAPVEWGRYELVVETRQAGQAGGEQVGDEYAASAVTFSAGWFAPVASADTPDVLRIGLDKARYRVGEVARLRVVPRAPGVGVITVMSNRLIAMKTVRLETGENIITLPVTEAWGMGAYVGATVIRATSASATSPSSGPKTPGPGDAEARHAPLRAIGLKWASVAPGDHRLRVDILTDETPRPRAPLKLKLRVSGLRAGERARLTVAAVDVGILNLTGFAAPDPEGHYFGQRRLGMELRDLYGRLIDAGQGRPGRLRSGGDEAPGMRVKSPPPQGDTVAFFSGPVEVDDSGQATLSFDIPDFNGTIRLMVVAWSKTGVGQASRDVILRDPVVLTASLPRFLAPGDRSRMLLEIAHVDGPAGKVGIALATSGGLTVERGALPASIQIARAQKVTLSVPITAPAAVPPPGTTPTVTVTLTTPTGRRLNQSLRLPVRAGDPEIRRQSRVSLADGKDFILSPDMFDGLLAGTGRATLAVGPVARFNVPGLLAALNRYPYGCSEQLASTALPLLYLGPVARAMGIGSGDDLDARVERAITAVLQNQSSGGSFGLWSPGSGDLWLDAHVTDFLSRARASGLDVPEDAFRLALENLRNRVNYAADFQRGGQGIAYALMVLAREGRANIGDLRYYADARADAMATPMALAQLGAGLAFYGDRRRAETMFRKAVTMLRLGRDRPEDMFWRVDYGSRLRDAAAVLALAAESGADMRDRDLLIGMLRPALEGRVLSTQESMWTLLAAKALLDETPSGGFLVNGRPAEGPVVARISATQMAGGDVVRVRNNSGAGAMTVVTVVGKPSDPVPAGGNGYRIARAYFDVQGRPVDVAEVALNQRLVVVITVTPQRTGKGRLMIVDPLPAGFEIDNPDLLRAGDIKALDWLKPTTSTRHVEFRSDRFLAAVDRGGSKPFSLAYVVRAISPGRFHHPAASVEDMYRPEFRARTAAGQVIVADR